MKKVLIASGVILSALLMGAVLWERDRSSIPSKSLEATAGSISSVESEANSVQGPNNKVEEPQPSYTKLGAAFGWVPYNDRIARMGYYDHKAKAFYAWKGVDVPVEQIPGFTSWGGSLPLDLRALKITEVEPPPAHYMPLPDGHFAPGFYDGTVSIRFYRWKGIRLKKDQIPAEAFKKYVLPEGLVKYPIDIDPPQYARK